MSKIIKGIIISFFFILISFHSLSAKTIQEITQKNASKPVSFRFNPPDDIEFVTTLTKTVIQDKGLYGKVEEVSTFKSKITLGRTPKGFTLVEQPLLISVVRNGVKVGNPLLTLLNDIFISYDLDSKGHLEVVYGYHNFSKRMKRTFSPEEYIKLSTVFNEEMFIQEEKAKWYTRVGQFIERKVRLGDSWKGVEEYALPMGRDKVQLFTTTKVNDRVPCGGQDCLQILITYNSDPLNIQDVLDRLLGDPTEGFNEAEREQQVSSIKVNGQGTRLIDPKTMLIYEENILRTVQMPVIVIGQKKVLATITERQEYHVDYDF